MTVFAFTGPDGAGKSTQVQRAQERLEARGLTVLRHNKWDVVDADRFPAYRFVRSSVDELRDCITEMEGETRAMFIFWTIAAAIADLRSKADVHLLDGYWYKHAAVESILGCSPEWIASLTSVFPRPDQVVYLRVDPGVALARKKTLTAYECGRDFSRSSSRFLVHQENLTGLMDEWAARDRWTCIDANRDEEQVGAELDRWLDEWLR